MGGNKIMILAQIEINNVPKNVNMISNYGDYLVVRYCDDGLWYYGVYDDVQRAQMAAKEINNGFVIRIWR